MAAVALPAMARLAVVVVEHQLNDLPDDGHDGSRLPPLVGCRSSATHPNVIGGQDLNHHTAMRHQEGL
jgi:hypothetical protein